MRSDEPAPGLPDPATTGVVESVEWISAEVLRELSAPVVLLVLALLAFRWWGNDRNARITQIQQSADERVKQAEKTAERAEREAERWREAFNESEKARERTSGSLQQALEVGRTATATIESLRTGFDNFMAGRSPSDRNG